MEKVNRVILSLGSNIEDRVIHLKNALHQIEEEVGPIIQKSSVFQTESVGFISDIPFYNMCIEIETSHSPESLLEKTQKIEIEIGRKNKTTDYYESRKIDIDIILFADRIIETKSLFIPHKHYTSRKFVLIPLSELNRPIKDPTNDFTVHELLKKCTDNSDVKRTAIAI